MSPDEVTLEAYKQAFEMIRHYGTLRFTVLTAFVVISGGLFALALSKRVRDWRDAEFLFPAIAGIVIAFVFGSAELRISQNFEHYWQQTVKLGETLQMSDEVRRRPPGFEFWADFPTLLMLIIYAGAFALWLTAGCVVWRRGQVAPQRGPTPAPNQPPQPIGGPAIPAEVLPPAG